MNGNKSISTPSRIIMILMLGAFSLRAAIAQTTVSASKIMDEIKDGRDISYENATITGDLDFTYMDWKIDDLPRRSKWWNSSSNEVDESIEVSISFINCTFEDDVLAYIHDDPTGYTFTADFERDVTFKNCEFSRKAMFKYSDFDDDVSFEGSKFRRESTFKYAEFDDFANFAGATFNDDAIFKYSDFDRGVSFENTVFEESLNIKYLDVRGDFNIRDMRVDDDIDSKYTTINGRSFTSYLLKNRN
ncbi:MAG: pentapeptide repeat-containing protein [Cyclobacteriaceae bacterium]